MGWDLNFQKEVSHTYIVRLGYSRISILYIIFFKKISHLNDTIYHLILKNGYNNSKKIKKNGYNDSKQYLMRVIRSKS